MLRVMACDSTRHVARGDIDTYAFSVTLLFVVTLIPALRARAPQNMISRERVTRGERVIIRLQRRALLLRSLTIARGTMRAAAYAAHAASSLILPMPFID